MFTSSVRRVARTSTASLPVVPRSSAAVSVACSACLAATRNHQRRYSSSKPPVPPSDGSRGIDASPQTPAKGVSPSNEDAGEKRVSKRRGKENGGNASAKSKHDTFLNLPSVPSTQHLHPHDIHVASFFSIHRPMSVTTSVPPNANPDAFSAIFSSKKQSKSRSNDVIYTISSAVNAIENALPDHRIHPASEENDLRAVVTQASASNAESVTHLDGVPIQDLRVSIQEFAKSLRPFNPPPPPVPMDEAESPDEGSESKSDSRHQSYSTILTIRESTHADGHKTYEAHTTPLVRIDDMDAPSAYKGGDIQEGNAPSMTDVPSRFLERIRIRQLRRDSSRERRGSLR